MGQPRAWRAARRPPARRSSCRWGVESGTASVELHWPWQLCSLGQRTGKVSPAFIPGALHLAPTPTEAGVGAGRTQPRQFSGPVLRPSSTARPCGEEQGASRLTHKHCAHVAFPAGAQERAEQYRAKCAGLEGRLAEMEAATAKWQGQADEVRRCTSTAGLPSFAEALPSSLPSFNARAPFLPALLPGIACMPLLPKAWWRCRVPHSTPCTLHRRPCAAQPQRGSACPAPRSPAAGGAGAGAAALPARGPAVRNQLGARGL